MITDFEMEYENLDQFKRELSQLLNRHGIDAAFEIQDFLLADYMTASAVIFASVQQERNRLLGITPDKNVDKVLANG
jgi:hypothetical protein